MKSGYSFLCLLVSQASSQADHAEQQVEFPIVSYC